MNTRVRRGFRARRERPKQIREEKDTGTPELTHKREHGLTHEVIDTYHARRIINDHQHRAALRFRWLYTLRYGSPSVQAVDPSASSRGRELMQRDESWRSKKDAEYKEAAYCLRQLNLLDAVLDVAVFNTPLKGLHAQNLRSLDTHSATTAANEANAFIDGLNALCAHWRRGK